MREVTRARSEIIASARRAGRSYSGIARDLGISGERVRQIMLDAEEAESGKIAGCAVAVTWEGERAADPSIGLYRWGTSWALIGASAALTKAMLEDDDA